MKYFSHKICVIGTIVGMLCAILGILICIVGRLPISYYIMNFSCLAVNIILFFGLKKLSKLLDDNDK